MVKNNASRNINILSKMILDEDAEMGSESTNMHQKLRTKENFSLLCQVQDNLLGK